MGITAALAAIAFQKHVPSIEWAFLTGVFIAGYTLVDGAGVRADNEAIKYIPTALALQCITLTPIVLKLRSYTKLKESIQHDTLRLLLGGVASVIAYGLVMNAARSTPLGLVSALRETSTIIGVVLGAILLKETVTKRHWIGTITAALATVTIGIS